MRLALLGRRAKLSGAAASRKVTAKTASQKQSYRFLNIQEYQSKILMERYGLNVQRFKVADTPAQAASAAKELQAKELVIKAQILAGGRGLGTFSNGFKGGVHLCKTPEEASKLATSMLGYKLVTKQTQAGGVLVQKLMIAESINIAREVYVSILMDRDSNGPVFVVSPKGGVDIEKVAEETPEAIFKEVIDIKSGPKREQLERLAKGLEFKAGKQMEDGVQQLERLYKLFIGLDAVQVEVNPLAETPEGQIFCVDAKIGFDDNAMFRHQDVFEMRDLAEEDPRELEAQKYNLNYIAMDGNIGCMVNGAGLAMATMDIIKMNKGDPANFLDVGGSATEQAVTEAFKILTGDQQVKAILVNIFGGIMKCDTIAAGIVAAAKTVKLSIPLVVRLAGTNVEIGKTILKESGLPIITAENLDDAAAKAVASLSKL